MRKSKVFCPDCDQQTDPQVCLAHRDCIICPQCWYCDKGGSWAPSR